MTQEAIASLKRERSSLLNQYIKARENEKVKILVKIMDIDEELEVSSLKPQPQKALF